jgi:hypothetical protein
MICWVTLVIPLFLFIAWVRQSHRILGLTLIGVLIMTLIVPAPAFAQFGIIGGIQSLLNLINGSIRGILNGIGTVMQAIERLHEEIIWPVRLIQQARDALALLISQTRVALGEIFTTPVQSATLPVPSDLEAKIRNGQTNDFAALAQSYNQTFGAVPDAKDADSTIRNLIDSDDAVALGALKALKASDQSAALILDAGNRIEDGASSAAPGSAPFLTATGVAANIQSQAMMQKMLAAIIRQEATKIAEENGRRKRYGLLVNKAQQGVSDILQRR